MDCNVRQIGDITILDLKGRLSLGEVLTIGSGSGGNLNDAICELTKQGRKRVLLNLAGVTDVDSSGVGQLIGARTSGRYQGADLKLLNPTKKVRSMLELTKLDSVFDIADDESRAIASFSKDTTLST